MRLRANNTRKMSIGRGIRSLIIMACSGMRAARKTGNDITICRNRTVLYYRVRGNTERYGNCMECIERTSLSRCDILLWLSR